MFEPHKYIERIDDNLVLCINPVADGGLSAMTINVNLSDENRQVFCESIKRMVLAKLFSPKFAEVILTATEINPTLNRKTA
jgi:hypothetical protein